MKVKTYRAATFKAALEQIKKELGSDAFILGRKEVKPGRMMGVIRRNCVEVTAAVDYEHQETPAAGAAGDIEAVQDRVQFSVETVEAAPQPVEPAAALPSPQPALENEALMNEIRKLRTMVQSIAAERPRSTVFVKPESLTSDVAEQTYSDLLAQGVEEDMALSLVLASETSAAGPGEIVPAIAAALARRVRISAQPGKEARTGHPEIVALIGPTGVGKTTTLAKIAARAALHQGLKVGLVTLDTFRIAAVEQLKTYAEIMGIPLRVVDNVNQMKFALQNFADRDLVLIDTTGRSHHDVANEPELTEFMSHSRQIHKVLVLSATTKDSDLADITRRYEICGTNSLIFTKLDETNSYGPILNELVRSGKPLLYVTVGQAVPQDILRLDVRKIAELLLGAGTAAAVEPRERWKRFVDAARPAQDPFVCEATF